MKQWVKKLVDQLDVDWNHDKKSSTPPTVDLNEEKATLLYIIDTYNKNLFEIDKQPVRKVRESLDQFAKALVHPQNENSEKALFQFRQFFSSYRVDEYAYIQKTFEDFKKIIWDFADQLNEDIEFEKVKDTEAKKSFEDLKEAVEANSIDELRTKSREFIDFYIKYTNQKDERRTKRIASIRKNLNSVKKQLLEANHSIHIDHLTNAHNRRSFDEQIKKHAQMSQISKAPVSLVILDIDHFKKVNDCYGHDIGDFVIKECVRMMKEAFNRPEDFVARIGGEEFAILCPDYSIEQTVQKCEEALNKVRKEVFVHDKLEIRFTVSMGVAIYNQSETSEQWIKAADSALYHSKNTGRNKLSVAGQITPIKSVA